jgi:hypothetical protein
MLLVHVCFSANRTCGACETDHVSHRGAQVCATPSICARSASTLDDTICECSEQSGRQSTDTTFEHGIQQMTQARLRPACTQSRPSGSCSRSCNSDMQLTGEATRGVQNAVCRLVLGRMADCTPPKKLMIFIPRDGFKVQPTFSKEFGEVGSRKKGTRAEAADQCSQSHLPEAGSHHPLSSFQPKSPALRQFTTNAPTSALRFRQRKQPPTCRASSK